MTAQPRPKGATWVTRQHVFVERIACPWLIQRFIDPDARFEFVPWDADPRELEAQGTVPFDMEGARFGHRTMADGTTLSTFEVLLSEFGLDDPALAKMAEVIHAADIKGELDTVPEARGLKAIHWGWRFNHLDDHEAVREGSRIYDALYTWARYELLRQQEGSHLDAMEPLERYRYLRQKLAR